MNTASALRLLRLIRRILRLVKTLRRRRSSLADKDGLQIQNQAAEMKLKAERKLGAMLGDMPKEPGKRTDLTSFQDGTRLPWEEEAKAIAPAEPAEANTLMWVVSRLKTDGLYLETCVFLHAPELEGLKAALAVAKAGNAVLKLATQAIDRL